MYVNARGIGCALNIKYSQQPILIHRRLSLPIYSRHSHCIHQLSSVYSTSPVSVRIPGPSHSLLTRAARASIQQKAFHQDYWTITLAICANTSSTTMSSPTAQIAACISSKSQQTATQDLSALERPTNATSLYKRGAADFVDDNEYGCGDISAKSDSDFGTFEYPHLRPPHIERIRAVWERPLYHNHHGFLASWHF